MRPSVSSPFPRWITRWETQLVGRELFGTTLLPEKAIVANSFTCNVWEGCWGDRIQRLAVCMGHDQRSYPCSRFWCEPERARREVAGSGRSRGQSVATSDGGWGADGRGA